MWGWDWQEMRDWGQTEKQLEFWREYTQKWWATEYRIWSKGRELWRMQQPGDKGILPRAFAPVQQWPSGLALLFVESTSGFSCGTQGCALWTTKPWFGNFPGEAQPRAAGLHTALAGPPRRLEKRKRRWGLQQTSTEMMQISDPSLLLNGWLMIPSWWLCSDYQQPDRT